MLSQYPDTVIARLLGAFRKGALALAWPDFKKGKKGDVCKAIAKHKNYAQMTAFFGEQFGGCRQHVQVLNRAPDGADVELPDEIPNGVEIIKGLDFSLYVSELTIRGVMTSPVEETSLRLLRLVKIEVLDDFVVIRCVILEKALQAHFPRKFTPTDRGLAEHKLIEQIASDLGLQAADINKGIKHLWASGEIDTPDAICRESDGTAEYHQDAGVYIRKHKPTRYDDMMQRPLHSCRFDFMAPSEPPSSVESDDDQEGDDPADTPEARVRSFGTDPTKGRINFFRSSKDPADTGRVIQKILESN